MPALIPTKKFLEDVETLRNDKAMRKKLAKPLGLLQGNPFHPGLHLERIVNDPSAWAIRVDRRYRISFEPETLLKSGTPDWSGKFSCSDFSVTTTCTNVPCERQAGRRAELGRGRNAGCPAPPAQIPACATNAPGSCLRFWR